MRKLSKAFWTVSYLGGSMILIWVTAFFGSLLSIPYVQPSVSIKYESSLVGNLDSIDLLVPVSEASWPEGHITPDDMLCQDKPLDSSAVSWRRLYANSHDLVSRVAVPEADGMMMTTFSRIVPRTFRLVICRSLDNYDLSIPQTNWLNNEVYIIASDDETHALSMVREKTIFRTLVIENLLYYIFLGMINLTILYLLIGSPSSGFLRLSITELLSLTLVHGCVILPAVAPLSASPFNVRLLCFICLFVFKWLVVRLAVRDETSVRRAMLVSIPYLVSIFMVTFFFQRLLL